MGKAVLDPLVRGAKIFVLREFSVVKESVRRQVFEGYRGTEENS